MENILTRKQQPVPSNEIQQVEYQHAVVPTISEMNGSQPDISAKSDPGNMAGRAKKRTKGSILLYENKSENDRITNDARQRAMMLNNILQHGLTNDQIKDIRSPNNIEAHVHQEHLKVNEELARLEKAGITGLQAELPPNLVSLRYALMSWQTVFGPNKYAHIHFDGSEWQVDEESLERHFIANGTRIYLSPDRAAEYKALQNLCDYLHTQKAKDNKSWHARSSCNGWNGPQSTT